MYNGMRCMCVLELATTQICISLARGSKRGSARGVRATETPTSFFHPREPRTLLPEAARTGRGTAACGYSPGGPLGPGGAEIYTGEGAEAPRSPRRHGGALNAAGGSRCPGAARGAGGSGGARAAGRAREDRGARGARGAGGSRGASRRLKGFEARRSPRRRRTLPSKGPCSGGRPESYAKSTKVPEVPVPEPPEAPEAAGLSEAPEEPHSSTEAAAAPRRGRGA